MTPMTVTAKDVAELRARTGAGMMDCKKALEEAGGDMARATEILRAKGIAKAEKRAGRTTSQGLIAGTLLPDGSRGGLVEVTCETDFVARNDDFQKAVQELLNQVMAIEPMTLEAFLTQPASGPHGQTVADQVKELTAKTGENVALRNAVKYAPGHSGVVGIYLHHNRQVGVLVELEGGSEGVARGPAAQELARELALHIASADPIAVRGEDIRPTSSTASGALPKSRWPPRANRKRSAARLSRARSRSSCRSGPCSTSSGSGTTRRPSVSW